MAADLTRHAWVDARSGVTGDMWLGALVAAGASLEAIERGVQTLGIGDVRVSWARVRRGGRDAVSVRVRPPAETPGVSTVAQVRALLEFAALDEPVRLRALAIFDRLAQAEADAQGVPVADVRFHEVAMLDDLAAIVGASIGVHHLAVDRWFAGPVGLPPEDAADPVASHLLAHHLTRRVETHEPVLTAVGAAILATLAAPSPEPPELNVEAEGAGAASRDLADAGLLHVVVGTPVGDGDRAAVAQERTI